MDWSDEEIDELLVRYLDQELSSDEFEQFEQLLTVDSSLRQKLSDWKELNAGLSEIRMPAESRQALGPDFAKRIIELAQSRVREQGESSLAPWITRHGSTSTVDSASRLQNRDFDAATNLDVADRRPAARRWWWAASAIAASLLAIAFLSLPQPALNTLLTKPDTNLSRNDTDFLQSPAEPIVIQDTNEAIVKATPILETAGDRIATNDSPTSTVTASPKQLEVGEMSSKQFASNPDRVASAEMRTNEGASSTVGPDLAPTAEQIQMLEGMLANPNGMFLFVIDVEVQENVTDLDSLRSVLDRHDIAWASELEIDESIQAKLAKSRMIAEAGKQGLIPDFVDPSLGRSKSEGNAADAMVVSLVFVKARGARLDAAIIEVMKQTEEFPVFSFDLAFDPPTHALMNELRFIQEASLPSSNPHNAENVSSMIRHTGNAARNAIVSNFSAGPRRTKEMGLETRRQSKLPINSEMMNPIAYALFIVRHAERGSTR